MPARGTRNGLLYVVVVLAGLGLIWAGESAAADRGSRARSVDEPNQERTTRRKFKRAARRGVPQIGLDEAQLEILAELGYAEFIETDRPDVSGVTIHDRERAWNELNLYKSFGAKEAHLMDMDGEVLHTWRAPDRKKGKWAHVELLPGGRLLGLVRAECVELVDWDSTLLWRADVPAHHDVAIDGQGRLLVLIERLRDLGIRGETVPIRDDAIAILTPDGELQEEIWLSELLAGFVAPEVVREIQQNIAAGKPSGASHGKGMSVFHTNSIEVLPRDVPGLGRAGQVLVSMRSPSLIAVVDLDEPRLVWSWGTGELEGQHQPTLLPNDNLLIFDNRKTLRWSRVIEFDPREERIVWEYDAADPGALFSSSRGGSEPLPNGNVLVAESNRGRLFEVTRDGEIVWEFLNPEVKRNERGAIYRAHRLSAEERDSLPMEQP